MTEEDKGPRLHISLPGDPDFSHLTVRENGLTLRHEFCGCGSLICAVLLALILWRIW